MKHSQKAKYIFLACMLAVAVCSTIALFRTFWPSEGRPYEILTMEQAATYMQYEEGYALIDISTPREYEAGHADGAENIPYDTLFTQASQELTDLEQTIYICGADSDKRTKAAMKLCEMRYMNVAVIDGTDAPQTEGLTD